MKLLRVVFAVLIFGLVITVIYLPGRDLAPSGKHPAFAFILPHPPVIVPKIGGGLVNRAANTVSALNYVSEQITGVNPDTIVLITPHSVLNRKKFSVYASETIKGNLKEFGAPKVTLSLNNDPEFINELGQRLKNTGLELNPLPPETELDHGSLVPLYFINKAGYRGRYIIMNSSGVGPEAHVQFGELIRKTMENSGKKYVFIASGDLSHWQEGRDFDKKLIKAIKSGNYNEIIKMEPSFIKQARQCGYNSILIGLGVVGMKPMQNRVFSYEAPFGVGYMVGSL